MSSAFVVFGVGTSLSILVFLMELIFKRIRYQRQLLLKINDEEYAMKKAKEKKEFFDPKYFW